MTRNGNFMWLARDIDSTLVLKITSKDGNLNKDYLVFNVVDVLELDGDKLNIVTANIDDLSNLLSLGIVRFANISNTSDIIDIPFRKLLMLYDNASVLKDGMSGRFMSYKELEVFSVIDGDVRDDLLISSSVIDDVSEDLMEVMKIAASFDKYNMQGRFDAMNKMTLINHRRLLKEEKNRKYR